MKGGVIMTEKALLKVPEQCRHNIETLSSLIETYKEKANVHMEHQCKNKLKGYLGCLTDMGIISEAESRCLYLYYATI